MCDIRQLSARDWYGVALILSCGLQDDYRDETRSVIAADFYHANELLPLSDEEIVQRVHRNLSICEPAFAAAKVPAIFPSLYAEHLVLVGPMLLDSGGAM